MHAKQAREKAEAVEKAMDLKQYDEIINHIEVSVAIGNFSANYTDTIRPNIKRRLEALGYKIETSFNRGETDNNISW